MNIFPRFIRKRIEHRPSLLRVVDNIGWLFFDKILRLGFGLLVSIWVARYLGPDQFGLLSFSLAFVGLFSTIPSLGLQSIVIRDIVRDPETAPVTFGTTAFLQTLAGSVTYILTLGAITYLRPEDALTRSIVAILSAIMLLEGSKIAVYWFESQVQSKYTVWVQNGVFILFAVVKVILILNYAPLTAFVWAIFAEACISATLMVIVMSMKGISFTKLQIKIDRAKQLLRDSWPLVFSAISISIYVKIDQIMLGEMIGENAVGIYSAATRISEIWYFIPLTIVASLLPTIIKLKNNQEADYKRGLQKLYNLMSLLAFMLALPMTFISEIIVVLLYGEEYRNAGLVLSIHIWAAIPVFLGVASGSWLVAENMQMVQLFKALTGAFCNVALNYILIPFYGAIGAAVATLVSYSIADIFYDSTQARLREQFSMKIKSLTFYWVFNEK